MTRRKYVCDYCDKVFYDDPESRRRHFNGANHQRNKAQWYRDREREDRELALATAEQAAAEAADISITEHRKAELIAANAASVEAVRQGEQASVAWYDQLIRVILKQQGQDDSRALTVDDLLLLPPSLRPTDRLFQSEKHDVKWG